MDTITNMGMITATGTVTSMCMNTDTITNMIMRMGTGMCTRIRRL